MLSDVYTHLRPPCRRPRSSPPCTRHTSQSSRQSRCTDCSACPPPTEYNIYTNAIDWSGVVYSPSREYFTHIGTSAFPIRACKIQAFARQFRPVSRDLYRAVPAMSRDFGLQGLIWRTTPLSRLSRQARGTGVLI